MIQSMENLNQIGQALNNPYRGLASAVTNDQFIAMQEAQRAEALCFRRENVLRIAKEIIGDRGDWQEVIRAAREMLLFIENG